MKKVFVPPCTIDSPPEDAMPSDLLEAPPTQEGARVLTLLKAGIPLSLLIDLAGSDPHSEELYELENAS